MSTRPIILGDWGTSRMRLFLVQGEHVIDRSDGLGIGALAVAPIEALRAAVAGWLPQAPRHVTLCGMAGSRNGLIEVPYAECPASPTVWARQAVDLTLDGLGVTIVPGLACRGAWGAADVMRGEETQIFGAIEREPQLANGWHLLILPGTHSKWAVIEDGAVVRFQTFITGELFALLRDHSTLTRAGDRDDDRGSDADLALPAGAGGARAAGDRARRKRLLDCRAAEVRRHQSQGGLTCLSMI